MLYNSFFRNLPLYLILWIAIDRDHYCLFEDGASFRGQLINIDKFQESSEENIAISPKEFQKIVNWYSPLFVLDNALCLECKNFYNSELRLGLLIVTYMVTRKVKKAIHITHHPHKNIKNRGKAENLCQRLKNMARKQIDNGPLRTSFFSLICQWWLLNTRQIKPNTSNRLLA